MASRSTRKTWETAFLLSASMSSSYQQTFDQAQAILKDLGMENVQLGDEAERAAQRQENAITMAAAAIAEAGLTEVLGGIKNAYTEIIQTTSEFEYTMSAVEAISGAAANEVAELEEKARTLGETTVYTARESASAMTYMAQAGWDTIEMLEGMDGVISLAAASGTDLAETSSIVADTLAGFGMQANETGRLADVLAQAASHSNTNVSLMGQTFANSAAIAGALGFQIEDVSAMLGIMANNGIKGSRAGTTLRNILNGLAADATLTAEAFGEVQFSMFDENGQAKELVPVVRELRGYFAQMTEQEKFLNAKAIGGLRGYNGLLAILNATDEEFEELYADIQNADGAAKKMADTRLDNLKGDVTLLKSAFESLTITIGEELTPTGRDLVGWLTEAVQNVNGIIEKHPELIKNITANVVGIMSMVAALKIASAVIKGIQAIKLVFSLISGGGLIVAGIGAVVAAIGILAYQLKTNKTAAEEAAEAHREYARALEEQEAVMEESAKSVKDEWTNTLYLEDKLRRLMAVQDKTAAQKQEILTLVEMLNEKVPDLALAYDEEADKINKTTDAIRNQILAELEREEMEEKQKNLKERIRNQGELDEQVKTAESEYWRAKGGVREAQNAYDEVMEQYANGSFFYDFGGFKRGKAATALETAKTDLEAAEIAYKMLLGEKQKNDALIGIWSGELADYANRIKGETSEEAAEEAAGQEQINEAVSAAEDAGSFDVMNYFKNGSFSTEDVSADYEGAVTPAGGNVNVVTNITVEGNATEETAEEIGAVVEEKIVSFLEKEERRRDRMLYTGE